MVRPIAIIAVLVFATGGTTFAQRSGPLADALSARSVRLALPPTQTAAPAPAAHNQKTSHPVRKGFLIGSGVGLVVGILTARDGLNEPCPAGRSCSTQPIAMLAVPTFLVLGAAAGSVIGWMFVK